MTTTNTTAAGRMTPSEMYHNLKAKHPGAALLFRCSDSYEAYEDDAQTCSAVLGISVLPTSIDGLTLMAGFPRSALDDYLPRLIKAGHQVAIYDSLQPLDTTL